MAEQPVPERSEPPAAARPVQALSPRPEPVREEDSMEPCAMERESAEGASALSRAQMESPANAAEPTALKRGAAAALLRRSHEEPEMPAEQRSSQHALPLSQRRQLLSRDRRLAWF
jgi:hypothetical protein